MASKPPTSRLPPPSLFQGPPSRNASNLSLIPTPILPPSASSRNAAGPNDSSKLGAGFLHPDPASISRGRPRRSSAAVAQQSEIDRADAMWVEMQNTLAEVELSAENATHVFGSEHAKALEELRTAQIALAQAWSRSDGEDGSLGDLKRDDDGGKEDKTKEGGGQTSNALPLSEHGASDAPTGGPGKVGPAAAAASPTDDDVDIEEESQKDILMARKRREANDKYFQRVNEGVLDVVARLEEVALAMRKVEKESRDIWSETESIASTEEISAG